MNKVLLLDEQKYYDAHKDELLKSYRDKYIVVKSDEVIGPFNKQYEAYVAGINKYGNEPFLIKLVSETPEAPEHTPALWVGSITTNAS